MPGSAPLVVPRHSPDAIRYPPSPIPAYRPRRQNNNHCIDIAQEIATSPKLPLPQRTSPRKVTVPPQAPSLTPRSPQPDLHTRPAVAAPTTYTQKQRRIIDSAMDRFDVINFADLVGPGGGSWVRIGGGSFGVVFKGEYLGTSVAIKEVLPNNTYDVEKYFERECVLMKEARHPNIVQYIGLTKSPGADGRIYIVSEFVGNNLRNHLADRSKPFPWRLRISFAMDIARAVAYLHARKCLHRDLKGENLLITSNDRVKVCDFGFARIAARNEEEMKRISYCGTDGYMSPEILLGLDFSLPSDIFSLGIIFCEIASRHLVDSTVFKRQVPDFGLDEDEVREMASPGCPQHFIQLCLDCVRTDARDRPQMREVVRRLRDIELEVIAREEQESKGTVKAIGSVRGSSLRAIIEGGSKIANKTAGRTMPSFHSVEPTEQIDCSSRTELKRILNSSGSEDEDLEAALAHLEGLQVTADAQGMPSTGHMIEKPFKAAGHGNPWWSETSDGHSSTANVDPSFEPEPTPPLCTAGIETMPVYSRPIVHSDDPGTDAGSRHGEQAMPALAEESDSVSTLTIRGNAHSAIVSPPQQCAQPSSLAAANKAAATTSETCSYKSASSKLSAAEVAPYDGKEGAMPCKSASQARAIEDETVTTLSQPLHHRFTLIRNGTRRPVLAMRNPRITNTTPSLSAPNSPSNEASRTPTNPAVIGSTPSGATLLPPALMLTQALARCDVCARRIGWKPFLDCDDCPYRCHVTCGEAAEPTCREIDLTVEMSDPGQPKGRVGTSGASTSCVPAVERLMPNSTINHPRYHQHHRGGCGSNAPVVTTVNVNAEKEGHTLTESDDVGQVGKAIIATAPVVVGNLLSASAGAAIATAALACSAAQDTITRKDESIGSAGRAAAGGAAARLKRWSRGGGGGAGGTPSRRGAVTAL